MLVARMTFLRPRSGARNTLCCSSSVTLECRGRTVRLGEGEGRGRGGGGEGEGEGRLQRHLEPATHSEQGREQLHYPP